MKKLPIFILCFLAVSAHSQVFREIHNAQSIDWISASVYLQIPYGANPILNSSRVMPGALFFRTSDSSIYAWTGVQFIKQGGSSTSAFDSTYIKYRLDSLANALKTDTVVHVSPYFTFTYPSGLKTLTFDPDSATLFRGGTSGLTIVNRSANEKQAVDSGATTGQYFLNDENEVGQVTRTTGTDATDYVANRVLYYYDNAVIGQANKVLARITVIANGLLPSSALTGIAFDLSGSSDASFTFGGIRLYATGNNPTFAASQQVGSEASGDPGSGPLTISGSSPYLLNGTNYFWLVADIADYAPNGDIVCVVNTITVGCVSGIVIASGVDVTYPFPIPYKMRVVAPLAPLAPPSWNLTGNSDTDPSTNFIGTTDNKGLLFKVNNLQSGYIDRVRFNLSMGYQSLISNTTGTSNTAYGDSSLRSNTTGTGNVAIGLGAGSNLTNGSTNTAIGHNALFFARTIYGTTSVGRYAGAGLSTGNNCTFIGEQANPSNDSTIHNAIAIGYKARVAKSNTVSIGTKDSITYVGINTDSALAPLHVVGNTRLDGSLNVTGSILNFKGEQVVLTDGEENRNYFSADSSTYQIRIGDPNGNFTGTGYKMDVLNNTHRFFVNYDEAMRIDPSGNLGIGTTIPSEKLTLIGNLLMAGQATVNGSLFQNGASVLLTAADNMRQFFKADSANYTINIGDYDGNVTGTGEHLDVINKTYQLYISGSEALRADVTGITVSNIVSARNVLNTSALQSDADFTATPGKRYNLPAVSTDRTITLDANPQDGDTYQFNNNLQILGNWILNSPVLYPDGSSSSVISAQANIVIYYDLSLSTYVLQSKTN